MSTACVESSNKSFLAFPINRGVSEDAEALRREVTELVDSFAQSVTIGEYYRQTRQSLFKATMECSRDNWDGYGAKAIDWGSYVNATYFSQLLPTHIPIPEIYVDPEGEVTFEWYAGPRQVFSVSTGPNKELVFAGLFGANKTHGTEYLDDELPETILDNIHRVF
ncbi:MAG: hypothetical protein KAX25_03015 [Dehalococcoidia bacterium]|nr:hypothetical protein [Dehalococcoidia bacterium]